MRADLRHSRRNDSQIRLVFVKLNRLILGPESQGNRDRRKPHFRSQIVCNILVGWDNEYIKAVLFHCPENATFSAKEIFLLHYLLVLFTLNVDPFRFRPQKFSNIPLRVIFS
jgi:hypothetical protein